MCSRLTAYVCACGSIGHRKPVRFMCQFSRFHFYLTVEPICILLCTRMTELVRHANFNRFTRVDAHHPRMYIRVCDSETQTFILLSSCRPNYATIIYGNCIWFAIFYIAHEAIADRRMFLIHYTRVYDRMRCNGLNLCGKLLLKVIIIANALKKSYKMH